MVDGASIGVQSGKHQVSGERGFTRISAFQSRRISPTRIYSDLAARKARTRREFSPIWSFILNWLMPAS